MKRNVGSADTVIRVVIAAAAAVLILTGTLSGAAAVIAGIAAAVLLITGITGFCGLYSLLGINTNRQRARQQGG